MEQVLHNINKLNRSLEGVIAVRATFSPDIVQERPSDSAEIKAVGSSAKEVIANVMAKQPEQGEDGEAEGNKGAEEEEEEQADAREGSKSRESK
ncbi:MAG: hypothetical protein Q9177_001239 [Variospora cf. flavescens]